MAQVWENPALTAMYWPGGTSVWSYWSLPQHATLPSTASAQVCASPAVTRRYWPSGGVDWPSSSSPQQASVPSVRTPHVWRVPAETSRNRSVGGLDWSSLSSPQQRTVPSVMTPQLWRLPLALTTRKVSGGGSDSSPSLPQHQAVPLVRRAHACDCPKLRVGRVSVPASGVAAPAGVAPPSPKAVSMSRTVTTTERRKLRGTTASWIGTWRALGRSVRVRRG
ncbi:MAG: hypothetical protein U0667_01220 [Chloroflexota bacterium]